MWEIRKVLTLVMLFLVLVEIGRTADEKHKSSGEHGSKSGEKGPKSHEHDSKGDKHDSKSSEESSKNWLCGGLPKLTITPVVGPFNHAEGPHWDHRTQKLYFVDIVDKKIHKFDPILLTVTTAYIKEGSVGFVIPVEDTSDKFVAGVNRNFDLITWNSDKNETNPLVQVLTSVDSDHPGNRWNDGKADSSGRFWGGTIGREVNEVVEANKAALYKITETLIPNKEVSSVTVSNGLAWNIEDTTFYYIDTGRRQIAAYDYESFSGTIRNQRIIFDFAKNNLPGLPDGMTIDVDGYLYVAQYNAYHILKINPVDGKIVGRIRLPVKKVTSVTFGGPLLDTLYITTSRRGLTAEELKKQPYAGYVFTVKGLRTHGIIANSFKLCG